MLPLYYFTVMGAVFLALGLSGVIATRHFVIVVLSIELIFVGSIIALAGFFFYSSLLDGSFFAVLLSVWVVVCVEIISLVAFYVYMRSKEIDFDLNKLARLKG